MTTAEQIARAWHSVYLEWGARKNKARTDGRMWEVYVTNPALPIDESNPKVVASYIYAEQAAAQAGRLEDRARGEAVLQLFKDKRS
jgi:hypothetical protein